MSESCDIKTISSKYPFLQNREQVYYIRLYVSWVNYLTFSRIPKILSNLQLMFDMQRILSTERLQLSICDSWWNLWGPAILKHAFVEKTKSKVAHVLENLADKGMYVEMAA